MGDDAGGADQHNNQDDQSSAGGRRSSKVGRTKTRVIEMSGYKTVAPGLELMAVNADAHPNGKLNAFNGAPQAMLAMVQLQRDTGKHLIWNEFQRVGWQHLGQLPAGIVSVQCNAGITIC